MKFESCEHYNDGKSLTIVSYSFGRMHHVYVFIEKLAQRGGVKQAKFSLGVLD